ncbi:hypothetical protein [Pseudarthrobacter sp. 1C304]|uniref:hypothetical protein n=1 Tax=Pseudarthrobacter sp. 1C304 TaxID=3457438 RepID=UPI003FD28347
MTERTPHDGGPGRAGHGTRWDSLRVYRVLARFFTVTASVALAVVILDLFIGRPIAGDLFNLTLNSLAAAVLWRRSKERSQA